MYTVYFGLREAPFSITPDPRYLYMSERHQEALAHLLHGSAEGGSVVQLTGEAGTGKTTLCRCFLEQLPPQVDVALILNPRLTARELLATVCDELDITSPAGTTSLKELVDALYRYLLDAHARGRRTVLIIDEAQNLAPDVLEQIRLLTNLETAREKLLQVILIGQPELIGLLDRRKLRQFAQRVTARYHLLPLSLPETRAYTRHRLEVAGQTRAMFTEGAIRHVYRFSKGIPRLINVICDRALLGAYARDRHHVDAATARRAALEVFGRTQKPRRRALVALAALGVLGTALAGAWVAPGAGLWLRGPSKLAALLPDAPAPAPASITAALPPAEPRGVGGSPVTDLAASAPSPQLAPVRLANVLLDPAVHTDKQSAFASLFSLWGLNTEGLPGGLWCGREQRGGVQCLFRMGTWKKLRRFNLPAVIELVTPSGDRHYTTVTALGAESATLNFGGQEFTSSLSEIDVLWDGTFIVLWKPPPLASIPIQPGAHGRDVRWLRQQLAALHGRSLPGGNPDVYDDALWARVVAFQRSRSLVADGVVGEETLAQLSLALGESGIPSLSDPTR
ncbi:MAG: AAA family ATPase [Candidatus Rokubacteria bacterium]|nr:AAA family ATPase [Candidatus Rokubacteria bacterium]